MTARSICFDLLSHIGQVYPHLIKDLLYKPHGLQRVFRIRRFFPSLIGLAALRSLSF